MMHIYIYTSISKHSNYTENLMNTPSKETKDIFQCKFLSVKPDHDYEIEMLW